MGGDLLVSLVQRADINVESVDIGGSELSSGDSALEEQVNLGKGSTGDFGKTEVAVDDAAEA